LRDAVAGGQPAITRRRHGGAWANR
jgi:hypothetical protein